MQHTEKKTSNGYGCRARAMLAACLLSLTGPAAAVAAQSAPQPVLSIPAAGQSAATPVAEEATVSINQADAEQLASILKGVGLKKAEGIVRYREQNGPFTQIEQLQEVPGIGPALFEKNRARLKM
ncbi:ComEA family DNA-binding protein [Serratia entomophila]|uniref:ComEA family DNA-binding protein n=1 Tax=Serratia entomophila TaxID=42906 RepID=UPI002178A3C3|nr:ComEA family DNA-binding protein [Serratia entomophila]CAI0972719.1 competence protein ComEA helix-hairpin-helix repeat region [Serratia entomophila]CAI1757114.1 competence protein ComEA helix-hairpin-helix repeat region [Serratia entomophila]CAI1810682.1 competence protein ComEA helix-hairpin-helix repeat region [Serratia entomophila]CAI1873984.1 competence protein ComEA helix-hairpin-helix repeat region [Serratia entomophila]CAI1896064.1 competence protein ComEA helix-hairpin-helix repeat